MTVQLVFKVPDGNLTEVENGSSQSRVHLGQCFEKRDKILNTARAAGGNDRHIDRVADRVQHFQIEALLHEHIEYQKDSMKDYDPDQYQILGSSEVVTNGVYTAMFISAEQSTMAEIFSGSFK